jgi:hypothetical protein
MGIFLQCADQFSHHIGFGKSRIGDAYFETNVDFLGIPGRLPYMHSNWATG